MYVADEEHIISTDCIKIVERTGQPPVCCLRIRYAWSPSAITIEYGNYSKERDAMFEQLMEALVDERLRAEHDKAQQRADRLHDAIVKAHKMLRECGGVSSVTRSPFIVLRDALDEDD